MERLNCLLCRGLLGPDVFPEQRLLTRLSDKNHNILNQRSSHSVWVDFKFILFKYQIRW
jgi:hypothetical protein